MRTDDLPRLLKSWRARSNVSQLELSLRCDVSQKHISFIESARSSPSRAMVLQICEALNIPLRDRNGLLTAAGYAPEYRETALSEPELAAVDQALDMMLKQQEPYLGKTAEEITASLESQGYQVRKVETEDGLLEAYAMIDGKRYEIYVDPANGTIVKIEDD